MPSTSSRPSIATARQHEGRTTPSILRCERGPAPPSRVGARPAASRLTLLHVRNLPSMARWHDSCHLPSRCSRPRTRTLRSASIGFPATSTRPVPRTRYQTVDPLGARRAASYFCDLNAAIRAVDADCRNISPPPRLDGHPSDSLSLPLVALPVGAVSRRTLLHLQHTRRVGVLTTSCLLTPFRNLGIWSGYRPFPPLPPSIRFRFPLSIRQASTLGRPKDASLISHGFCRYSSSDLTTCLALLSSKTRSCATVQQNLRQLSASLPRPLTRST
ncbi:hypothetical protein CDD83_874 [Cordyceps sp. RAO-2017]|nr:hypothetical protein CDD83_874 [Cordyceps sp. RAO-2017]